MMSTQTKTVMVVDDSATVIAANVAWVAPVAALSFYVIGKIVGNRISAEDEVNGADLGEMGVLGYDFGGGATHGVSARTMWL